MRHLTSPFTRNRNSVQWVMQQVVLATVPGAAVLFYFFGWGVIFNLVTCVAVCLFTEAAIFRLRRRPWHQGLHDYSALVTAILLGLALPPLAPWWIPVIGSLFAIIFAKHLYGGLGYNPFNPAMAGYVLLLISFPLSMTTWLPPASLATQVPNFAESWWLFLSGSDGQGHTLTWYLANIDGFAMATPLDELKTGLGMGYRQPEILQASIFAGYVNQGWQWVNVAFLIGGLYLLFRNIIQWHIPIGMLGAMLVLSSVLYWLDPDQHIAASIHLFSGATMLGAFFIATDPVSAATTPKGRIVFGAGVGCLVVLIRNFGGYPDAVAFAVLLMNMSAPLIDHYTRPTVYGAKEVE